MRPLLFTPITLRSLEIRNRIAVSPMCMYSSEDGFANEWHFVHLASRAVGGAGIVFTEAAAVQAVGRISPQDLGIYRDEHVTELSRINAFVKQHGAVAGIQLAHAGRKASCHRPWSGRGAVAPENGGWQVVGPGDNAFAENYPVPKALTENEIREVVADFARAAERSLEAGFQIAEIHAAHGYLLHQFLSPLSNQRDGRYGGSFENRVRLTLEVVEAVRAVWPEDLPLFVRISATDWAPGGWDLDQSVQLCALLRDRGVDLVDCSSGGAVLAQEILAGPGYQAPFAARIRAESGVPTGAVGLITSPEQAEHVLHSGQADIVLLARELLRDPYWPRRAAAAFRVEIEAPAQYARAW